jgi:quercetin dioxygenase-like cupin family protein
VAASKPEGRGSRTTVGTEKACPGLTRRSFDQPAELRRFDVASGQLEAINTDGGAVGRATFLPGWKWSDHVRPIAKTGSCRPAHIGYFLSGRMRVVIDDGELTEYGPGDFAVMRPGRDA